MKEKRKNFKQIFKLSLIYIKIYMFSAKSIFNFLEKCIIDYFNKYY